MEVNPALLPVFLPLCERHDPVGLRCQHAAYVFQQLGSEESAQTEKRIHMWGWRKGWEHKMHSDELYREPMGVWWVTGPNAGQLLSWINWSNKLSESNSQWTSKQKWQLFFASMIRNKRSFLVVKRLKSAWKWPDFIIVVMFALKSLYMTIRSHCWC